LVATYIEGAKPALLATNYETIHIIPIICLRKTATMVKQAKATKKFEKNKLKGTLEKRKEVAKVKQRHQVKDARKRKAAKRAEKEQQAHSEEEVEATDEEIENLDDDTFFQEPFQIPGEDSKKSTKQHIGKRKRDTDGTEEAGEAVEQLDIEEDDSDDSEDDDMGMNKAQLEKLAEKDPEFYKYLQENDAELLEFDEDADLEQLELSDSEDDRPAKKQKKDAIAPDQSTVTSEMVQKWKRSLSDQQSIRTLRQVVLAFRAAAHINDPEEKEFKFTIPDSDVYHEILVTALKEVPLVLQHHLPVKESAAGKVRIPTDSPKFKTLSPLIKSHVSSLHYLLSHLSDSATLRLTLQSLEPLLPYLLQFRKFLKVIIKSISAIWSDNSSDEATRITAFLNIRRLMVVGDAGIRETVLKATYEGIVKGSRNTTIHTLAGINLMKNSAAEIFGIDQKISYTTSFTFIRQLAIHLRSNITKPTKDSYKSIYNWQFVHSLDFWSRVLATHCASLLEAQTGKPSHLRPLIYPVVQITLGVMRLIPTSTYFPLRFHLIRSLLRISHATGTYIPLASVLLEVLNSAEMKRPPKAATLRPFPFESNIRASASYLKTRVYQDGLGEQVTELLSEFFALWAKSIAYPELQLPVTVMLKRWLKAASSKSSGNRNGKVNQGLMLVVAKSEANARWIEERRVGVTFSPKDRAEVEGFLKDVDWRETPLGAFVVGQRELREQRAKVAREGREEERKRVMKAREGGKEDDEEMEL
jgi:nucleolar complex protein 2